MRNLHITLFGLSVLLCSLATAGQKEETLVRGLISALDSTAPRTPPATSVLAGRRILVANVDAEEIVEQFGAPQIVIAERLEDGKLRLLDSFRNGIDDNYTFGFERETLILRGTNVHQGLYSSTYRVRMVRGQLMIVAKSWQSQTPADAETELWEGANVDLLSARAEIWAKALPLPIEGAYTRAFYEAFDRDVWPDGRTVRKIRLKAAEPRPLSQLHEDPWAGISTCGYFALQGHRTLVYRERISPDCLR